jgi:hypothetical protein
MQPQRREGAKGKVDFDSLSREPRRGLYESLADRTVGLVRSTKIFVTLILVPFKLQYVNESLADASGYNKTDSL